MSKSTKLISGDDLKGTLVVITKGGGKILVAATEKTASEAMNAWFNARMKAGGYGSVTEEDIQKNQSLLDKGVLLMEHPIHAETDASYAQAVIALSDVAGMYFNTVAEDTQGYMQIQYYQFMQEWLRLQIANIKSGEDWKSGEDD